MAINANITCAYAGISDLFLRTYDENYLPLQGGGNWDWNRQSPVPMQYAEWHDASEMQTGCAACLFDLLTGYTRTFWGSQASTYNGDPYNLAYDWRNGLLAGFVIPASVATRFPSFTALPITYTGVETHIKKWQRTTILGDFFPPPPMPNTGMPIPGRGINSLLNNGIVYSSAEIGGGVGPSGDYAALMPTGKQGNFSVSLFPSDLNFGTAGRYGSAVFVPSNPALGIESPLTDNVIVVSDGTGGVRPYLFVRTDFSNAVGYYSVYGINPPNSDFDAVNFFMFSGNSPALSEQGWIYEVQNVTLDGVFYANLILLAAPDFSSYRFINIKPMDTNAAAIWSHGSPYFSIDRLGNTWGKYGSFGNYIFVGSAAPPGFVSASLNRGIPPTAITVNPGLYR